MVSVSVIVATYKPNFDKEMATLRSIVVQRNIDFEIIICDDGSENDFFNDIEKYFSIIKFDRYKLIKNKNNVGIVKNFYSGLKCAIGKYIFCTSPGDMLIDENVLSDFYYFCNRGNIDIAFGNAIYYSYDNGKLNFYREVSKPRKPEIYTDKYSRLQTAVSFLFANDTILGATYFRKREVMLKYMERVLDTSVLVEDGTTTAYALIDGVDITYFNREMVAYEYGMGISTCSNSEWDRKINKDYVCTYKKMIDLYPHNSLVKTIELSMKYHNSIFRRLIQTIKHPIIAMFRLRYCFIKKKTVNIDYNEMEKNIRKLIIEEDNG